MNLRKKILKDFSSWDIDTQKRELEGYKSIGSFSPLSEGDYYLMEMVMNDPNLQVECKDGTCFTEPITLEESSWSQTSAAAQIDNVENRTKIIHLLDILFDDNNDILPDNSVLKAPVLLSTLKKLIGDLSKSSKSKNTVDIFFDKNNNSTSKNVDPIILSLIKATKMDKIRFSKSNNIGKFFIKHTGENGSLTFQEALSIPVIKLLIVLASSNKTSLNAGEKKIVFGDDNLKVIKSNKPLSKKIDTFVTKISSVIKKLLSGVNDYEQTKLNDIEKSDMSDEEKDLEKLKILGVEKDEKKTPGKKIADEIEKSSVSEKRSLILTKMGYDEAKKKEILDDIATSKELSKIDEPLVYGTAVNNVNARWKELKSLNMTLAESLFNNKFSGEGKGERLIEFLFPTISVNGGGESFDLKGTNGSNNFEVKAYQFDGEIVKPIKLGVEGKATQSNLFNEIQIIISRLQNIFSNPKHYSILKTMINGVENEDELKDLVDRISTQLSNPIPKTSKTFKEALASGEFSVNAIENINVLLKNLHQLFEMLKKNKFFYMKVVGKQNEIYKIQKVEQKQDKTIFTSELTSTTQADEQEVISNIIDVLGNTSLSKNTESYFTKVLEELETIINRDFKKHPMLLMYDTGNNDSKGKSTGIGKFNDIVNGIYYDFRVQAITRGNVAIMPAEQYEKKFGIK